MIAVSVLLLGLTAATTESFDAVVQEVRIPPGIPENFTEEFLTQELENRLTRLNSGYVAAVASVTTDHVVEWTRLLDLRVSTETHLRKIHTGVIRTLGDLQRLKSMIDRAKGIMKIPFDDQIPVMKAAIRECSKALTDSLIADNISKLGRMPYASLRFRGVPTLSNDLDAMVGIFGESYPLPSGSQGDASTIVYLLTSMNMHYLHVRIVLILNERADLVARLDHLRRTTQWSLSNAYDNCDTVVIENILEHLGWN